MMTLVPFGQQRPGLRRRHLPWWVWPIAIPIILALSPLVIVLFVSVLLSESPGELWEVITGRRLKAWKAEEDAAARGALGEWEK